MIMQPYQTDSGQPPIARAYVYAGEWVADCPRPNTDPEQPERPACNNVEFLYRPAAPNGPRVIPIDFYMCSHCGYQSVIAWPRRREDIMIALNVRPVPDNRNWYPRNHPVAVRFKIPHGQTIRDLLDENEEYGVSNEPIKELR